MEKFATLTAKVIPLPLRDVDTDLIIPAQYLTSTSKDGYAENLFRRLKDNDPNFPMNLPKYKGAQILVADDNFGCGSSREHAVWALTGAGIRVVICKSFSDIFYSNSAKNGLLLVTLPADVVDKLLADATENDLELTVDLSNQTVTLPSDEVYTFDFDSFRKHCLLNGLDDIDYILANEKEITAFKKNQESNQYYKTTD